MNENILTDGTTLSRARLLFREGGYVHAFPGRGDGAHVWWGELRANDLLSAPLEGPRVELLDERLRVVAGDLAGREVRVPRSGLHHLRAHGTGRAIVRLRRPTTPARP